MAHNLYSERQVALIRESGRIAAECLDLVRRMIAPGVTTRQLEAAIAAHIAARGGTPPFLNYELAGKPPYPAVACISVNDVVVHGLPSDVPLKNGDLVSVDVGVRKNGYIGDTARTFPVGELDERGKLLLQTGEEALFAGINAARHRGKIGEISRAVQTLVESRGFSVVRDYVGHGVGQALHEPPQIPNYVEPGALLPVIGKSLQAGMVVALEPMVNEGGPDVITIAAEWPVRTADGGRSVHFEHTIAVLADRVEIMTAL